RVVRSAPLCSPCSYVGGRVGLREGCAARTCMRMVTPAHVIAAARELLSGARAGTPPAAPQPPGPDLPERARRRTVSILGVPVDDITFDALLDQIGAWVRTGGPARQIATAN